MKLGPITVLDRDPEGALKWLLRVGRWRFGAPPRHLPNAVGGRNLTVIYLARTPLVDVDVRGLWETNPDVVPCHNHGVEMHRLCVLGGYDETRDDGSAREIRPGRVNLLGHHEYHRVTRLLRRPTWTIGYSARWRGVSEPAFLDLDGPVPIAEWVTGRLGDTEVADGFRRAQR